MAARNITIAPNSNTSKASFPSPWQARTERCDRVALSAPQTRPSSNTCRAYCGPRGFFDKRARISSFRFDLWPPSVVEGKTQEKYERLVLDADSGQSDVARFRS